MARIIHVCPRYLPAVGGVELFVARLSEALVSRGHSVEVWTTNAATVRGFTSQIEPRIERSRESINGVDVIRFPVRYLPFQKYLRTLAHQLPFGTRWRCDTLRWTPWVPALTHSAVRRSAPVDVVYAAALPYSSVLYAGLRLADRTGARLIMSPFTHVAPPGPQGAKMKRAYLSRLNLQLLARADRVFVQTDLELGALCDAGVPSRRQRVVGLGVDPADTSGGSRDRAHKAWRVPPGNTVVGHLGNKSWDKGTVDLLDAAERLWDLGRAFTLVLAGPAMPSFTNRWLRARHRDRIVNLGPLSDIERRDFFAAIDIFALPSYVESFGVTSLEAALNGAAVLAYHHGGPAQIFRHRVDALLPRVADIDDLAAGLDALVSNRDLRTRLASAAATTASRYSWKHVLDVALSEYDQLLADTANQRRIL